MEDSQEKLRLIYKRKKIILKFFPRNFEQLRDCFLSLFNEKSFKKYTFTSYLSEQLNENSKIILNEDNDFAANIRKIKLMKNPAVFINVQDDDDNENEIDKINIEYIIKKENELGFEINKENREEYIKRIKQELERKLELFNKLKFRVDNLNVAVSKIKKLQDLSESQNKIEQENVNNILNKLHDETI